MNYLELSIKDTEKETIKLAERIKNENQFAPDIVVFISKGSYIIGKTFSDYFKVPLVEIFAVREGNKLKEIISPLLRVIPKRLKKYLRSKELKSGVHSKNTQRKVYFEKGNELLQKAINILIVDDSVDTGYTAKQVYEYIDKSFGENKVIKFASLNYFEESKVVFEVEYTLYKNSIMVGPWSKDSKYHKEFILQYSRAKEKGAF
ncbi:MULTISPECIES: phosphoribosyltransferase [Priestia]|uniref:phosphoribosyltransferase n=1 Tax=Priestia TaxID=2800373 RepID=UPI002E1EE5B5|nr:phosphoribosyltransferase [Priestia aryabhattai]